MPTVPVRRSVAPCKAFDIPGCRLTFLFFVTLFLSVPPVAWAERVYNTMSVYRVSGQEGVFEVHRKALAGPGDYWCAAGDFTKRFLRMPGNTRIYVLRGPGPALTWPGRRSVIFTVVETPRIADAAQQDFGYTLSVDKVGYNQIAAHGWAGCRDSRLKFAGRKGG